MTATTKDNIEKKRKVVKRRRRIKVFRLIFMLVLLALIGSAILFVGIGIYHVAGRAYNEVTSMYQGYTERKVARTGAVDPKLEGYTNILILGVDNGDEGEPQADTIFVLSFSNDTGKSRLISIPRDTWVTADSSSGKIGKLYAVGGANLIVHHPNEILNLIDFRK